MALTDFQGAALAAVAFLITLTVAVRSILIARPVTIPDDPFWPLYVVIVISLFMFLYWGVEAVRIFGG